jgi:hypothetical protein
MEMFIFAENGNLESENMLSSYFHAHIYLFNYFLSKLRNSVFYLINFFSGVETVPTFYLTVLFLILLLSFFNLLTCVYIVPPYHRASRQNLFCPLFSDFVEEKTYKIKTKT